MSDRLTIVIHLPQSVPAVADLMDFVNERWPGATLDVDGPDGWTIYVPADER